MASPKDLRLLAYFVEVVRAGSIRGAAAQLSLSPAVVSEALSELEEILGATLITRTTRSMTLTDIGGAVFHHASEVVAAADEAMTAAGAATKRPTGRVRITLPVELSIAWLPPILRGFEAQFSEIRVEVSADDAMVSLPTSTFDLAIRTTFSRNDRAGGDVCDSLPLELVCAPGLIDDPSEPLDARLKRIGIFGSTVSGRRERRVAAFPRANGGRAIQIDAPSRFVVDNQAVAHKLALEGFGAALLIGVGVADDLAAGRLARVDERYGYGFVIARIAQRDRYPSAAALALRQFLLR